jgi:cytochrome P450
MIVSDHAAAHHIFADTDNFVKSPAFRPPISNLLGRGVVWAEGDEHRIQRKIISPAFSYVSFSTRIDTY